MALRLYRQVRRGWNDTALGDFDQTTPTNGVARGPEIHIRFRPEKEGERDYAVRGSRADVLRLVTGLVRDMAVIDLMQREQDDPSQAGKLWGVTEAHRRHEAEAAEKVLAEIGEAVARRYGKG